MRTDEDRERFDRLYDDLVRVLGLSPAEALLNAATQFELGFDVRLVLPGAFQNGFRTRFSALGTFFLKLHQARFRPSFGERDRHIK